MRFRERADVDIADMIERLCLGDADAWTLFVSRYRRLIYSAIHRANTRFSAEWDETAMDELFEDVLFKLLRRDGKALASWKGRCSLETWIYRIVRNVCIDRLRRDGRRAEVAGHDEAAAERSADLARCESAGVGLRDLSISLEQAIENCLSTREALAVRLIYLEGFTYREVAGRLGMTLGAVSGLVYRALEKLRRDGGVARHWKGR